MGGMLVSDDPRPARIGPASRRSFLTSGLAVAAAGVTGANRGAAAARDPIEMALVRNLAKWRVPGASYAIVRNGRITAGAVGVRRAGSRTAVLPDTLFQAASLSKTVAAVAAMVLVDRSKLALDTDINNELTIWKLPPSPLAEGRTVTLRRLLGMTAGINVPGYGGYRPGAALPTLTDILDGKPPANSAAVRIVAAPGTAYSYSGGGYEIVQAAIQGATDEGFGQFARDAVLVPSGMALSGFDQPLHAERATNVAAGHLTNGDAMPGGGNVLPELAAAGMWSTPTDLARLLIALWASYRGAVGALLTRPTTGEMFKSVDSLGYGLGGSVRGAGRNLVFMKRGHNLGFHSYMLMFPETGQAGVIMTNSENGEHVIEPFLRRIGEREGWPGFGPLAD